ncbi:MAG: hypothetical protein AABX49_00030 [Nanoarchaeota archaeon]
MVSRLYYELPKEKESVVEIIDSIPSDWSWMDGVLKHPEELMRQGKIAEDTILYVSRWHSIKPTIRGRTIPGKAYGEGNKYVEPKLIDIFLNEKFVSDVVFEEAGFGSSSGITLDTAKEIAKRFVLLGYTGFITSPRKDYDNCPSWNPERLSIWQEGNREYKDFPPFVELKWDEKYGGRRERLNDIVENCERLGLKQL